MRVEEFGELHDDPRRCAELAGLVYIEGEPPGIARRRNGKGFRYHDPARKPIADVELKERIAALAIPPAWRNVWICPASDGHILATGEDDRGRKQYIYHPRWRTLRDLINFYRLIMFGQALPTVRKHVQAQLRRRTLDRERLIAGMIAILDSTFIRVGNEVYAEENDSFGLSTLTQQHVQLEGRAVRLAFTAKSGKPVEITITDAPLTRLMRELLATPGDRLFVANGEAVGSDEVNQALFQISGKHITAKDFRTWGGTLTAFSYLREHRDSSGDPAAVAVQAVDEAAEALGNTRTVARAHYVHPHLLSSFTEESFADYLKRSRPARQPALEENERALAGFLQVLVGSELRRLDAGG